MFYTNTLGAAFKRQAEYQRKVLESMGYEVELVRTDNVDIFQREWNNMDPKTTTAVVISHCNRMSLIFEHDSKTNAISANGYNKDGSIKLPAISGLNGPEIMVLYLYACNAGIKSCWHSKEQMLQTLFAIFRMWTLYTHLMGRLDSVRQAFLEAPLSLDFT